MIAARMLPTPEPRHGEREQRRPRRAATMRRAAWLPIGAVAAGPFVLVMAYVALMAHVTSLGYSYERARGELQKARSEHLLLQDEVARLESPQRLAAIATRLGMKDPADELVVRLNPPPAVARRGPLANEAALLSEAAGSILRLR